MWPDFGKSVLMSHFTTQMFITKIRNGNFQSTWKWLQCVVPTLNYQKIIGNTLKSSVILCGGHNELCKFYVFQCDIKTDFPKSGHIWATWAGCAATLLCSGRICQMFEPAYNTKTHASSESSVLYKAFLFEQKHKKLYYKQYFLNLITQWTRHKYSTKSLLITCTNSCLLRYMARLKISIGRVNSLYEYCN